MWVKLTLNQFYKWNLRYALSEDHAARKAIYFFSSLFFVGVFGLGIIINLQIGERFSDSEIFFAAGAASVIVIFSLFTIFLKEKRYKSINHSISKASSGKGRTMAVIYIVVTVLLYLSSFYMTYLKSRN